MNTQLPAPTVKYNNAETTLYLKQPKYNGKTMLRLEVEAPTLLLLLVSLFTWLLRHNHATFRLLVRILVTSKFKAVFQKAVNKNKWVQ